MTLQVDSIEFPDDADYSSEADFAAAMSRYVEFARDQNRQYLLHWNAFQRFGSAVARHYPTDAAAIKEGKVSLSQLRTDLCVARLGNTWRAIIRKSVVAFSSSGA